MSSALTNYGSIQGGGPHWAVQEEPDTGLRSGAAQTCLERRLIRIDPINFDSTDCYRLLLIAGISAVATYILTGIVVDQIDTRAKGEIVGLYPNCSLPANDKYNVTRCNGRDFKAEDRVYTKYEPFELTSKILGPLVLIGGSFSLFFIATLGPQILKRWKQQNQNLGVQRIIDQMPNNRDEVLSGNILTVIGPHLSQACLRQLNLRQMSTMPGIINARVTDLTDLQRSLWEFLERIPTQPANLLTTVLKQGYYATKLSTDPFLLEAAIRQLTVQQRQNAHVQAAFRAIIFPDKLLNQRTRRPSVAAFFQQVSTENLTARQARQRIQFEVVNPAPESEERPKIKLTVGGQSREVAHDLLVQQSDYFQAQLTSTMTDLRNGELIFTDVDPESFFAMLDYIETGVVTLQPETVPGLLEVATRFEVSPLKTRIQEFFIDKDAPEEELMKWLKLTHHHDLPILKGVCEDLLSRKFPENDIDKALKMLALAKKKNLPRLKQGIIYQVAKAGGRELNQEGLIFWVRVADALSMGLQQEYFDQFKRLCDASVDCLNAVWVHGTAVNSRGLKQLCRHYSTENPERASLSWPDGIWPDELSPAHEMV